MPDPGRHIEIVGVAGSGKSTLTHLLCTIPGWRPADGLHTRRVSHWPHVARALPTVAPLVIASAFRRPALTWAETKDLMYVSVWWRHFESVERAGSVTVVDQGPVFSMARLLWGRKPVTRSCRFRTWLRHAVTEWSRRLDVIVWLDAPDRVLVQRVNGRSQPHEAKNADVVAGTALLRLHRVAYEEVLAAIEAETSVPVLRFDTSDQTSREVAEELLQGLGPPLPLWETPLAAGRTIP